MFCCTLLYVHSSIAIILMGKIELVALLNLSICIYLSYKADFIQCHKNQIMSLVKSEFLIGTISF